MRGEVELLILNSSSAHMQISHILGFFSLKATHTREFTLAGARPAQLRQVRRRRKSPAQLSQHVSISVITGEWRENGKHPHIGTCENRRSA